MAEERMVPRWFAFDGTDYATKAECTAHEEANFEHVLVGLTPEEIRAALARDPRAASISFALEKAGTAIARARVAAGDVKRRTRARAAAEAGTSQQSAQDEERPDSEAEAPAEQEEAA